MSVSSNQTRFITGEESPPALSFAIMEEHTVKLSSQYRNTTALQRRLSFGRKKTLTIQKVSSSCSSFLYKRIGWRYLKREFCILGKDLCYRIEDETVNGGTVVSLVVKRDDLLEFSIYTTQREFRLRAEDRDTLDQWIRACQQIEHYN